MAEYGPYAPLGFAAPPMRLPRPEELDDLLAYRPPPRELRAPLSPAGNALMGATGLPTALGPAVDLTTRLGQATGETASEATMIPWAFRTGDQLAEAAARGGFLPDLGGQAQAQEGDRLTQLNTQMEKLLNDRNIAVKARDDQLRGKGGAKAGEGPLYQDKNEEVKRLDMSISALQKSIKREEDLRDPAYQREQERLAQVAQDQRNKELSEQPFRQKYAAWANALPNYGIALSMGVPALMGAARNLRTLMPNSPQSRMMTAIEENMAARTATPVTAAVKAQEAATRAELKNATEKVNSYWGQTKGARDAGVSGLAGGGLAAEASMYPDQYDMFNLPPGPEKDAARQRALDWLNYVERGGVGTLTGLSGYKVGTKFTPQRDYPISRAEALADLPPNWPKAASPKKKKP